MLVNLSELDLDLVLLKKDRHNANHPEISGSVQEEKL